MDRHQQLIDLGFVLDNLEPFHTWNHENGTWICDFALEQYSNKEWDSFLSEFEQANTNP